MREKSLPLRWFQQFILLLRSLPLFAFSVPRLRELLCWIWFEAV